MEERGDGAGCAGAEGVTLGSFMTGGAAAETAVDGAEAAETFVGAEFGVLREWRVQMKKPEIRTQAAATICFQGIAGDG